MERPSGAGFLSGLGRFIASLFGWAGNSFSESEALREELAKEQEVGDETRDPS